MELASAVFTDLEETDAAVATRAVRSADAVSLARENECLRAELRARSSELAAARIRVVEVADAERRRVERNLHDGAQQHLLAIAIKLQRARIRTRRDDAAAAGVLLDEALGDLKNTTAELRELARGAHPAILTDYGLSAAVEALAELTPMRVELLSMPTLRLAPLIEATAYFIVAEAIANTLRYAQASVVAIEILTDGHATTVEVRDDGIGGADFGAGTGLRGLADRVTALNGELHIVSPVGEGTLVRATIGARTLALVDARSQPAD